MSNYVSLSISNKRTNSNTGCNIDVFSTYAMFLEWVCLVKIGYYEEQSTFLDRCWT